MSKWNEAISVFETEYIEADDQRKIDILNHCAQTFYLIGQISPAATLSMQQQLYRSIETLNLRKTGFDKIWNTLLQFIEKEYAEKEAEENNYEDYEDYYAQEHSSEILLDRPSVPIKELEPITQEFVQVIPKDVIGTRIVRILKDELECDDIFTKSGVVGILKNTDLDDPDEVHMAKEFEAFTPDTIDAYISERIWTNEPKIIRENGKKRILTMNADLPEKVSRYILNSYSTNNFHRLRGVLNNAYLVENNPDTADIDGVSIQIPTTPYVLHSEPGYHADTQLYLHSEKRKITSMTTEEAVKFLKEEVYFDTRFEDKNIDFANTIGMGLMAFTLPLMKSGDIQPIFAIRASDPGGGKTSLINATLRPIINHDIPTTKYHENKAEFDKTLLPKILRGDQIIWFEDVPDETIIKSGTLAQVTSGDVYEDRILGQSRLARVRTNNSMFVISGNRIELEDQLVQRGVWIRLIVRERAETRKFEKRSMTEYNDWLVRETDTIYSAYHQLIQHWIAKKCPISNKQHRAKTLTQIVGGILETAEIQGFLDNRVQELKVNNQEYMDWSDFFKAVIDEIGTADITDETKHKHLHHEENKNVLQYLLENNYSQATLPFQSRDVFTIASRRSQGYTFAKGVGQTMKYENDLNILGKYLGKGSDGDRSKELAELLRKNSVVQLTRAGWSIMKLDKKYRNLNEYILVKLPENKKESGTEA